MKNVAETGTAPCAGITAGSSLAQPSRVLPDLAKTCPFLVLHMRMSYGLRLVHWKIGSSLAPAWPWESAGQEAP
eukprot:CAMPEP_0175304522 /NCGR_PEP_ID=MMETSP0093-20121207/63273_1 /TAXON_ID=311494 /ORGANISM="Alexandrium monilatum, Strain CCMP3105" /LENGTH=73 /DNA_ID=CAMNT_0016600923 /DNA_START=78 /DNA_END=296 /DNA_ORIENTATION=-